MIVKVPKNLKSFKIVNECPNLQNFKITKSQNLMLLK